MQRKNRSGSATCWEAQVVCQHVHMRKQVKSTLQHDDGLCCRPHSSRQQWHSGATTNAIMHARAGGVCCMLHIISQHKQLPQPRYLSTSPTCSSGACSPPSLPAAASPSSPAPGSSSLLLMCLPSITSRVYSAMSSSSLSSPSTHHTHRGSCRRRRQSAHVAFAGPRPTSVCPGHPPDELNHRLIALSSRQHSPTDCNS